MRGVSSRRLGRFPQTEQSWDTTHRQAKDEAALRGQGNPPPPDEPPVDRVHADRVVAVDRRDQSGHGTEEEKAVVGRDRNPAEDDAQTNDRGGTRCQWTPGG
jgi:hypothetical protein